jgi:hypothetical protein
MFHLLLLDISLYPFSTNTPVVFCANRIPGASASDALDSARLDQEYMCVVDAPTALHVHLVHKS